MIYKNINYIDAHSHIKTNNSFFCTSELLPKNLIDYSLLSKEELAYKYSFTSEIGLDRRYIKDINLNTQLSFFEYFFDYLVSKFHSVSLHCVKETETMINFLSNKKFIKYSILWHGFTGSFEIAERLEKLGVIISINSRKINDFKEYKLSNKYSVIETDYDGNNLADYYKLLDYNYSVASSKLGITKDYLSKICEESLNIFKINLDK